VAIYRKTGLARQFPFQSAQAAAGKVNHPSAAGADKMVMMLGSSSHNKAALLIASMQFADKSQPGEYFQGAVNGNQPNLWMQAMHFLIERRRAEMLMAKGNDIQYVSPLESELVTILPQRDR